MKKFKKINLMLLCLAPMVSNAEEKSLVSIDKYITMKADLNQSLARVHEDTESKNSKKSHIEDAPDIIESSFISNSKEKSLVGIDKYITIRAGLNQPLALSENSRLNNSQQTYITSVAAGIKICDPISVDLEYTYGGKFSAKSYDIDKISGLSWKIQSQSLMLNTNFYLTDDKSLINPYIRVGAGISRNKTSDYVKIVEREANQFSTVTHKGKTSNSFAWQIGAGLNIKYNSKFDIEFQYMFVNLGKAKTQNNSYSDTSDTPDITTLNLETYRAGKLRNHVFTIGIKFKL